MTTPGMPARTIPTLLLLGMYVAAVATLLLTGVQAGFTPKWLYEHFFLSIFYLLGVMTLPTVLVGAIVARTPDSAGTSAPNAVRTPPDYNDPD